MTGRFPELSWQEIWSYARKFSGDPESSGFVTLIRETEGLCPSLWQTPVGQVWGRSTDEELLEFLVAEQLIDRIYDPPKIGVRSGDAVLDIGGHLGVFARFALARGARQVIVVEPEPVNLVCLKKTFEAEIQEQTVLLAEVAAWNERTTLGFQVASEQNTGSGFVWDPKMPYGTITVQAIPIDEIVLELGLDRIDFLKMDIEGAEREALMGARKTLARFGPRMALCTYHQKDDYEVVSTIALTARPQYQLVASRNHVYFY